MWWILAALLLLIVWALWFILSFELWIAIAASAGIVVLALVVFLVRKLRASSSAKALERAIAAQGAQQAMNANPQRRAEIQELQKRVAEGIGALKKSKLGGKTGGSAALYSLPWYVIIGPPGAGKTTALKASGLEFPYADAGGGGVRGVGGTRNCDWWFTNEAILLDTAGRYTTESDDRDEWLSFLQMLKKYRSRRPINGVLVAISVAELIDANEQHLEATGKKIRARIDEVMTQLKMVVPVYVLFTKCDLIAGFNEFFGNMRKSDRSQAWGTTFKLDTPRNEPGKLFDAEFDVLCKQVHARSLKRLAEERNREAREKVYQFPLEFAGIKRNLSELIATTFQVNAFQGTPIFRGFYFTSGTQEGRPLDRVLGRMGQAMGIRTPEQSQQQVVESKSYFLYNVFTNVVFPDGNIAARSESEIRRQRIMRVAISAAALALGAILAFPNVVSFFNNRKFLADTEDRVKATAGINWGDGRPGSEKVKLLDPVLARLREIDDYKEHGVPFDMRFLMYQGDNIDAPVIKAYVSHLQRGFVAPVKQRLEDKLKQVKGDDYLRERRLLKTYLMLSDVQHLDVEWATGQFTQLWSEILRPTSSTSEADLKRLISPHVEYYLELLKTQRVTPVEPNRKLIESAQKTLMSVPVQKRYYDLFVNSLIEERYDETGDSGKANRMYPSMSLGDMFSARPDVLKYVSSVTYQKDKNWKEIEGPYTDKGHYAVVKNIKDGLGLLEREQWVVPLGPEEKGDRVPWNLKRLAEDYDQRYIDAWTEFFTDITVTTPATVQEAIDTYAILTQPEWPFLHLIRATEDGTQWKSIKPGWDDERAKKATGQLQTVADRKLSQVVSQKSGMQIRVSAPDLLKLGDRMSNVPPTFRSLVEFGVPSTSNGSAPVTETPLAKYVATLDTLKDSMTKEVDKNPRVSPLLFNEQLGDANNKVQALLQPFDDKARTLLSPLLLAPLKIVTTRLPPAGVRPASVIPQRGTQPPH